MADWTAITGIAVAGVLGPVIGATAAAWHQKRAFGYERGAADRAELRGLLDEAAVALHHVDYAHGAVDLAILTHGGWVGQYSPDALRSFETAGKVLDEIRERLVVRLGRHHALVAAFIATNENCLVGFRIVKGIANLGADPNGSLATEIERLEKSKRNFQASRERFLDLAAQADMGGLAL